MRKSNILFTGILVTALVFGSLIIFSDSQTGVPPQPNSQNTMTTETDNAMTADEAANQDSLQQEGYAGTVLAGTTTPYLAFEQTDYEKALRENKIIVLNFYADWCPICRAEAQDVNAAFESLDNPDVVGFQVNYNDPSTDANEKALAEQFSIPYQHTKVILVDGQEVLQETAQWNQQQFIDAITTASQQ